MTRSVSKRLDPKGKRFPFPQSLLFRRKKYFFQYSYSTLEVAKRTKARLESYGQSAIIVGLTRQPEHLHDKYAVYRRRKITGMK